jgi:hypothetical protein
MPSSQDCVATQLELGSLRMMDVDVEDHLSIQEFKVAHVLGKHFRSGEWGSPFRCGSVITCVMDGRSLYARVERFLKVDNVDSAGFASVTWFGVPEYPFDIPLVVKCSERQPQRLVDRYGCIVPITKIDPSQVMVERSPDGFCFMMRDSGLDTFVR